MSSLLIAMEANMDTKSHNSNNYHWLWEMKVSTEHLKISPMLRQMRESM